MKKYYKFAAAGIILISSFLINALPLAAQTAPPSCTNLQLMSGTCVPAGATTPPSYCNGSSAPSVSVPNGGFTYMNVQQCDTSGNCSTLNPDYHASLETATALAQKLGATVVANNNPLGDIGFTYSAPEYELVFPNGFSTNAGAVAKDYENGFSGVNNFVQTICGPGLSAGPSGSGANNGGGAAGNTITGSNGSLVSTINSALSTLQRILNNKMGTAITSNFPTSLKTVTVDLLNVRTSPSTSAPIIKQFRKGDTFSAFSSVQGESVEGVSAWWVIGSLSTSWYAWSGGTSQ